MSVFIKPVERSEASIEKSDGDWLTSQGYWHVKFKTPQRRAAPDRMIMANGGRCFFIEFKRPGKQATPLQEDYHKLLRARGFIVGVSHGRKETMAIVQEFRDSIVDDRELD